MDNRWVYTVHFTLSINLRLKEMKDKNILDFNSNAATLLDDGLKVIELIFNQKH